MKKPRWIFAGSLYVIVTVAVAAGCFLWGYHANQVVLPEDVIDGEADERVYNEQFQYRRTEYQDDFERYPWFDTISFIGEIIPYSEDYAGDKIYIRALDASGSSDAFGSNGWLAQQDGLVIEKDGEALQWEDLEMGDILRVVYLAGVVPLSAPATFRPIYIEVLS